MIVAHHASEIPPCTGGRGFVPTMGFLHAGHMSLVDLARSKSEQVVLSIFVNPTQFGPNEDFKKYPRDLDRDLAMAESHGVDVVYLPDENEVYPLGRDAISLDMGPISTVYEGALRPGHFSGVATVVARLFLLVQPNLAIFGQKDLQQWVILNRLQGALGLPVKLEMGPTFREPNALAMSSRNVYLNSAERDMASILSQELTRIKGLYKETDWSQLKRDVEYSRTRIGEYLKLDYFDIIDMATFKPAESKAEGNAIVAAVRVGPTRLLDNVLL